MTELTQLIAGVELGSQDSEVLLALVKAWQGANDPVATWYAAVKNHSGIIYRVATLNSLEQMLDFLQDMEALGMVDELEDALDQVDGFDAILMMPVQGSQK